VCASGCFWSSVRSPSSMEPAEKASSMALVVAGRERSTRTTAERAWGVRVLLRSISAGPRESAVLRAAASIRPVASSGGVVVVRLARTAVRMSLLSV
jgi:hypothetical protein